MKQQLIDKLIDIAIAEDIGAGDLTTTKLFKGINKKSKAEIIAKQDFVLAGTEVFKRFWKKVSRSAKIRCFYRDGDHVNFGDVLYEITGDIKSLLTYERIGLNFISRLSGISTLTSKYVEKIKKTKVKILDTRKTAPGWRLLEKDAVRAGGAKNHRTGLFDMVMIKDNHIQLAGNIKDAIEKVQKTLNKKIKIEVEVADLSELTQVLECKKLPHIIMLDNFKFHNIKKALNMIKGRARVEVSGGVNLNNIEGYAKLGVDYISIGALTHQATGVDVAMVVI